MQPLFYRFSEPVSKKSKLIIKTVKTNCIQSFKLKQGI